MRLDPASSVPVYEQIADGLRAQVAAGVFRPGDAGPSIRELAVRLLINPNTVKRAYDELEREGLIYSKKGLGMFVAERTVAGAISRTESTIRATFLRGLQMGLAAGLDRSEIDASYDRAWKARPGTTRTKSPPNGSTP